MGFDPGAIAISNPSASERTRFHPPVRVRIPSYNPFTGFPKPFRRPENFPKETIKEFDRRWDKVVYCGAEIHIGGDQS